MFVSPTRFHVLVWVAIVAGTGLGIPSTAQERDAADDAAMAAYADAANFQTNGATKVAIEAWEKYLRLYPEHRLAPNAAHYLGVCLMQQEQPDYVAAAEAFAKALRGDDFELREESLANRGWCLYASAGTGEDQNRSRLRESISVFATLRKEHPDSRYSDRALFYLAQAHQDLGEPAKAIEFYDAMLKLKAAGDSVLRCDAIYGRGVAREELQQYDEAIESYREILNECGDSSLALDVRLRLGDLMILRSRYDEAVEWFETAVEQAEAADDRAYALFRQAYALVQAERPGDAAVKYERLLAEYPDSRFAAEATLASAQSTYRSGDLEAAAERFTKVLQLQDPAATTEAAHWLARIYLSRGQGELALEVASRRLRDGAEGPYATALRLDRAEALSLDPATLPQSLQAFEQAYRQAPRDPLAPRALYNAAFSAFQLRKHDQAEELGSEFIRDFPEDELIPDVRFLQAESRLATGRPQEAGETYERLLTDGSEANPQRPLWILRAATVWIAAGEYQRAIDLLEREAKELTQPRQIAEARFLLGQSHAGLGEPSLAAESFRSVADALPEWPRNDEAALLAGQSLAEAGDEAAAAETWRELIERFPQSRLSDQARYKLAQLAGKTGDHAEALRWYDAVLAAGLDPGLKLYAMYGKGWSLMQAGEYSPAVEVLDDVLAEAGPRHPIRKDAWLARGISRRNLGDFATARDDLEAYLETDPAGMNLGHALYELALIDQHDQRYAAAADRLRRLLSEVPGYPATDQVLYELAWSLREVGATEEAVSQFTSLIERFPDFSLVAEAAFFVGQSEYERQHWQEAARQFEIAATKSNDGELTEKSLYRLGWSRFKTDDWDLAKEAFVRQAAEHPEGKLIADALMMIGECEFKPGRYEAAFAAYQRARERIRRQDERATNLQDSSERSVREIVLLHGGQSASQLRRWQEAIDWYDELRERFPATNYLPQVFYELGYAHQQSGDDAKAMQFYGEVANNYRNEAAARARFMMGELHFANRDYEQAVAEFQRVMFGFGADQAEATIRNWQARSGFEAARCCEALMQQASSESARRKSKELAIRFFRYVIDQHPRHELAAKARQQLEVVNKSS